jgi:hypothetical protein
MDRGRVGEDRGSKETDGFPLTAVVPYAAIEYLINHILLDAIDNCWWWRRIMSTPGMGSGNAKVSFTTGMKKDGKAVRGHPSIPLLPQFLTLSSHVNIHSPWSLYISDHNCTTPTSLQ